MQTPTAISILISRPKYVAQLIITTRIRIINDEAGQQQTKEIISETSLSRSTEN